MRATHGWSAVVALSLIGGVYAAPVRITPAALTGAAAPGTAAGVLFSGDFSAPLLDSQGRVCFHAKVAGPGVNTGNDEGIWAGAAGALGLVAREGGAAPQTGGATYEWLSVPVYSEGFVAFKAFLAG